MKKRIFIGLTTIVLSLGTFGGCTTSKASAEDIPVELEMVEEQAEPEKGSLEFYQNLAEELDEVEMYDSSELTLEDLQNRDGKIIIERCIGEVTSTELDGKVLNYQNPDYYYISYKGVEGAEVGNIILTYFIYNPETSYEDDILYRFDYIIDGKTMED